MLQKAIAEGIGTFALIFTGCGCIMVNHLFPSNLPPLVVPIVFGLVVTVMIYAVGHISGAHFNPAVTLGFAISRHLPWKNVLVYWVGQTSGAFAAIFILQTILPPMDVYGATIPQVNFLSAIVWEIILTFFLMFVIIAVATDTRAVGTMAGIAIGATVALGSFVGGPVTGASMNPIRSIIPALFEKNLSYLPIYIIGPFTGAVLAALTYQYLRKTK